MNQYNWCKNQPKRFHVESSSTFLKLSIEIFLEEIKAVLVEKYGFENGDNQYQWLNLESSDYQYSNAKVKLNDFQIEVSSTNLELSTDSVMDAIKHVVEEFDNRNESILLSFFWWCKEQSR